MESRYAQRRIDINRSLPANSCKHAALRKDHPRCAPSALAKLYSPEPVNSILGDKPDRFFTVIRFWIDETSGVALALKSGVPSYQVEDEEGGTHLLIHFPIEGGGRAMVSLAPVKHDRRPGGALVPAAGSS
jgi:hypothetical protein